MNNHPFHLVDNIPWPIIGSIGVMTITSGMVMWFHKFNMMLFILGFIIVILTMIQWWRDVTREATFQGLHTSKVSLSMKWGMVLFIVSEVLFFSSFLYHSFMDDYHQQLKLVYNDLQLELKHLIQ